MNYNLVVHTDLDDTSRFALAVGNINNYLAALPGETYSVVLVANGGAARFMTKTSEHAEALSALAARGVSLRVCANAMKKGGIVETDLAKGVTIVPAGVVELVHLQREGYAYIKP